MRFSKKIRENERLCDQLEIKTASAEAAKLFLHLEVFVCRILIPVDLHIRDVPLLGRGRLVDLDETLRRKWNMTLVISITATLLLGCCGIPDVLRALSSTCDKLLLHSNCAASLIGY